MPQKTVTAGASDNLAAVFGAYDSHVREIEERFSVRIADRHPMGESESLVVSGEDETNVARAALVLEYLMRMAGDGDTISDQSVDYLIGMIADGAEDELQAFGADTVCVTNKGKPIKPKTVGQKKYVDAIRRHTVVFGIGPAGTGKTFLAVAMAVDALRRKEVSRIILTRPAVEAGEKLGFLPGDLQNKIDPYLRPLNDALYEMLGADNYARQLERNAIEIAPLAYMRGRTLDDSFIILDEAQNTTPEQMKMFLTRLGFRSKVVVTGDPSQTDLLLGRKSGLAVALQVLREIDDIAIHRFSERDVVRHRLVQKIILAYEKYDRESARPAKRAAVHLRITEEKKGQKT